ncbi:MAG: T9SS type A sorting domain-containing protein [Saprospiraceae bacterium]|nr:T9SS type A sorting domain-containing protein [Saprospiraceae bacterium]
MKITYLLFLLLPTTATFSQNYFPFIQKGVFRDEFWAPELQFCIYLNGSRFWFQGDSVVNGQVYQKLCSAAIQGTPNTVFCPPYTVDTSVCAVFALMREDTAARKVYRYDFDAGVEYLLFDFSVQVGDTVAVGYPPESFIIQNEWYETWGDGSNRRTLSVSTLDNNDFNRWMESLGAFNSLWEPAVGLCICPHGFCYQQNGDNLYGDVCAQIVGVSELKTAPFDLKITPNPASQNIVVQMFEKESSPSQIVVFDMFGKIVARQETAGNQSGFEINVSHLPAATYSVSVFEKGKSIGTKRFQKI